MFEGRLLQGSLLKKILDAVKDLVSDVNFNCNESGLKLQAMDSSHVALISMQLNSDGFDHFRCDRNLVLGININNMAKMLKCASNDDIITLKAEDEADTITFMFESPDQDKVSDFEMKLMDIDAEELGIPEPEYDAIVRMPSSEFQRICRDLASIGDTVNIGVTKEGISFSTGGDIGKANVVCRQSGNVEKEEDQVTVQINAPVSLTFALRYLNNFTKATSLAPSVTLSLSKDLPITVDYQIEKLGHIRFYLAPKIEEDEGLEEVGEN